MATSRWQVLLILCGASWAFFGAHGDPQPVAGVVVNRDGKPIKGAEVRADLKDSSGRRFVTRTNNEGKYVFSALPTGKYAITVLAENGAHTEARVATVGMTAENGQPIRRFISALPYQVKPDFRSASSANVRTRYIWKPAETGSHIGGRWIKAAEGADPSTNQLENIVGSDLTHAPFLRVNSAPK